MDEGGADGSTGTSTLTSPSTPSTNGSEKKTSSGGLRSVRKGKGQASLLRFFRNDNKRSEEAKDSQPPPSSNCNNNMDSDRSRSPVLKSISKVKSLNTPLPTLQNQDDNANSTILGKDGELSPVFKRKSSTDSSADDSTMKSNSESSSVPQTTVTTVIQKPSSTVSVRILSKPLFVGAPSPEPKEEETSNEADPDESSTESPLGGISIKTLISKTSPTKRMLTSSDLDDSQDIPPCRKKVAQMASVENMSKSRKYVGACEYYESAEFPPGVLPTKKDIIQSMLYLLRPKPAGQAQKTIDAAADMLSMLVQEHWLFCNLYTIPKNVIKMHILNLYNSFLILEQPWKQRGNANIKRRANDFNIKCNLLFDIFCEDATQRRKLEHLHGINMTDFDWKFLNDQRNQRKMYCEDYVDKKFSKTMERRKQDIKAHTKKSSGEKYMETVASFSSSEESADETSDDSYKTSDEDDADDSYKTSDEDDGQATKKRRRVFMDCRASRDEMPLKYRHVRLCIREVKDEYYETVDKLKSVYHMSQKQAEAGIVETANIMFGRSWKYHDASDAIDIDTLPQSRNTQLAEENIEVLTLS